MLHIGERVVQILYLVVRMYIRKLDIKPSESDLACRFGELLQWAGKPADDAVYHQEQCQHTCKEGIDNLSGNRVQVMKNNFARADRTYRPSYMLDRGVEGI